METIVETVPQKKVPAFIKVLTVFSFVGVGTGAFYYLFLMYYTYRIREMAVLLDTFQISLNSPVETPFADNPDWYMWLQLTFLVAFISQFTSLIGIIYIRKLKNAGFVLYVLSESISLILLVVYSVKFKDSQAPDIMSQLFNGTRFVLIGTIIFDLTFLIMYHSNRKHLK